VPAAEAAKSARPAVDAQRLESALRQHDLRSLDGTRLDWNQLSGEVVVVSFWASWCKPCHREMPELDALHNELAKRGGRVVAISIDLDAENARRFAASRQLSLPIYHDGPRGLAKTLDLRSIPYTVVLDRQGAVAFATAGSGDEAMHELKRVARQLAGKEPLATAAAPGSEE
jgi:thiol-disulfide isomerase/thioredoxin